MDKLYFKVNAAIKNIIGKELIYSDNIAVVELIKNSKDAGATEARISFQNEEDITAGCIIISDNGKGMTLGEIKEKWLNIAYSEKKNKNGDILYAGNKGVGRFSCDRLGSKLTLYTKAKEGDYVKLLIDWEKFENRKREEEISHIPVSYELIQKNDFFHECNLQQFNTGTILKISSLRESWSTNKLKKLISELEKFSPSLEDKFSVFISSKNNDPTIKEKLNKKINNNILEKVSFKTTYIKSFIDQQGMNIKTSLYYQGSEVYTYKVKNPYPNLKHISTEIHYIDTIARAYFTKKIGVRLVDYGSIFLFYNNFRISPYGNARNDWLGIDQRKGQGRARYLGTRELLGRIDIIDRDGTFDVLTNREGLAQNKAFHQLIAYEKDDKASLLSTGEDNEGVEQESYGYITSIIRQLEAFIVDALDWNKFIDLIDPDSKRVISDKDLLKNPARYKMKEISPEKIQMVCERLLKSNWNIKNLLINHELIKHISLEAEKKYKDFLNDFLEKIDEKEIPELSSRDKGIAKKLIQDAHQQSQKYKKDKEISDEKRLKAEAEVQHKINELEEKEKTIEQINSVNTFLKKISNQDVEDLVVSMHSILVNISTIKNNVLSLLELENLPFESKELLAEIQEANQKNFNIAKFATLYNFADKQNTINGELTLFIHEYLKEVSKFPTNNRLEIIDKLNLDIFINKKFIPLEIMMLVENIISNSKKAKATKLVISNFITNDGKIGFTFKDNGIGITNDRYLKDISLIFEKGETSTKGSGLGLYQAKKTIAKMHGEVTVLQYNSCFELEILFK